MSKVIRNILGDFYSRNFLILSFFISLLFFPALKSMFAIWMADSNNSHGIIVPLIAAYIAYKIKFGDKRRVINSASCGRASFVIGLVSLVLSILLYFLGYFTDILFFNHIAFVFAMQSAVLALFGAEVFYTYLFPLFFLYFMVPIPVSIYAKVALPMQLFATKLSVFILGFTHIPVSADGNIIRIGGEMLTVAESCSGLRSLTVFIMLSVLFAYVADVSALKRVLIVAVSIPIAIAGNILRIVALSFVAYIYGAKTAIHLIHDVSGYVMFFIAFLFFQWFASFLSGKSS